ncbi:unnamed protein product [Vitrella brassicaformis CCMP3155]|uniref:Spondin domain-containing protein n=2 Tax=Vitrella brassicaformis TaxID=1169539 RepID=A0A0G4FGR9_VITBC|nr:unnamed protein product [Vitrella brassicaformis CCMP3155]|eukprot:CEM12643.1 unnamed protein product [Vitrella brassicaformis CCMP3155]
MWSLLAVLSLLCAPLLTLSAVYDARYGRLDVTSYVESDEAHAVNYYETTGIMCARVFFEPSFQNTVKRKLIFFTVTHYGKDASLPGEHSSSTAWFDTDLNPNPTASFDICVNDNSTHRLENGQMAAHPNLHADWLAFEERPFIGAEAGRQRFPADLKKKMHRGYHCEWIAFDQAFEDVPLFFASIEHQVIGMNPYNHSDTLWAEQVTPGAAKLCLRDAPIFETTGHFFQHVNWMAFPTHAIPSNAQGGTHRISWKRPADLSRPFDEASNAVPSSKKEKVLACQDVLFKTPFETLPYVQAMVNHKRSGDDDDRRSLGRVRPMVGKGKGDMSESMPPSHEAREEATTSWVEQISENGFRVCVAEMWYTAGDGLHRDLYVDWLAYDDTFLRDTKHLKAMESISAELKMSNLGVKDSEEAEDKLRASLEDALVETSGVSSDRVSVQIAEIRGDAAVIHFSVDPVTKSKKVEDDDDTGPGDAPPEDALATFATMLADNTSDIYRTAFGATYLSDKTEEDMELTFSADCLVSPWKASGPCSQKKCGGTGGQLPMKRWVIREPINNGRECPALKVDLQCHAEPCAMPPLTKKKEEIETIQASSIDDEGTEGGTTAEGDRKKDKDGAVTVVKTSGGGYQILSFPKPGDQPEGRLSGGAIAALILTPLIIIAGCVAFCAFRKYRLAGDSSGLDGVHSAGRSGRAAAVSAGASHGQTSIFGKSTESYRPQVDEATPHHPSDSSRSTVATKATDADASPNAPHKADMMA